MAENINIASFDFDSEKVFKNLIDLKNQMTVLKNEMGALRKGASDSAKQFSATAAKMLELEAAGEETSDEYKELEKQADEYSKALNVQNTLLETAESQMRILKDEYNATSAVVKALTNNQNELTNVMETSNKAISKEITSIASARASNKELLAIRNQLNPAIAEEAQLIQELNAKLDSNNAFIKENASAYEQQKINIGNYSESIREAFTDLNIFTKEGLSNFLTKSQQAGGSGKLLKDTFSQITTGIAGATRAALAFIATPIGAAIAVLAGFALAAKSVWDYNKSIEESVKLTKQLTGLTGTMADEVRTKAQAIADTFKQDFQKTLEVASQISQRTGQSITSVLDSINNGFTRGANVNGRYLDSLEEMFPRLEKGGLSLAEVNALIEQSQGVFAGDKFVDTLGEAVVALEEFTKAQSDALTNAFGKSFSDSISNGINSGSMSAKTALLEIYKEAERVNLSTEQWATITADVFKGVGEDIGGAEVILRNYNEALANTNRELTEEEKLQQQITDAAIEAGKAKDEALKSDSVISLTKNLELFWNKVQIVFFGTVKWIREAYEWFWEISNRSESLSSIWNNLQKIGAAFGRVIDTLQTTFGRLAEKFGIGNSEGSKFMSVILSIFDPIKKLENALNLFADSIVWVIDQFSEASIRAEAFGRTIGQTFYYIKNLDFASLVDISDKMEENVEAIKKENEAYKAKQDALKASQDLHNSLMGLTVEQANKVVDITKEQTKSQKDLDKEREEAFRQELQRMNEAIDLWIAQQGIKARTLKEDLEFERKVAEDSIKILDYELKNKKISRTKYQAEVLKLQNELGKLTAEMVAQNAEDELNEWIRLNQSILADENRLTDELILAEQRRLNESQQRRIQFEQERLAEELINEREYQNKVLAITEETEAEKNAIKKRYAEQQRAEEVTMRQLQFEEDLIALQERGATEFELRQAERDIQFQTELEKINSEREKNIISEEEYQARFSNIERKWNLENAKAIEQIEQTKQEAKMQLASQAFGLMAEILGKETAAGKAAAIAQTTIDTYKAAQSAYASLSGIPIVGPALGAVAAGIAVATGLLNVKKIVSTKTPKVDGNVRGYATGGRIAGGVAISRPNGDDVLITAKRGEVILNEEQQRKAGGYNFFSALGVPGFATGGVVGSMPASQSAFVQNQLVNQINVDAIRDAVREGAMEGSMEGSLTGSREGSSQGSQSGIRDLNSDIEILNKSAF